MQDWRWETFARLGTPQVELMNRLEKPMFEAGRFSSNCDQAKEKNTSTYHSKSLGKIRH